MEGRRGGDDGSSSGSDSGSSDVDGSGSVRPSNNSWGCVNKC